MAENSDGQEKSEEPTGKRVSDAREKGQVPRSRELGTMVMMLGSALGFYIFGPGIVHGMMELMRGGFDLPREQLFDDRFMLLRLKEAIFDALQSLSLFLALMAVVAFVSPMLMSGWLFSTQSLQPKFSKLNPMQGLKRIFGYQGLVELAKSLAKFTLLMGVAFLWLRGQVDAVLGMGLEPVEGGVAHIADMLFWTFLILSLALIILVAVDVPYQLYNHKRQLKMTKQEVKEEHKQSEGSPEVKGRIRRLQMEAAFKRMMAAVPEADVVVTNPTHYAVALKYDQDAMGAPRVVAKGVDLIAGRIRSEALGHEVPLVRFPPLARALYYSTELDQEIPAGLYLAVAQVLAYVYQVKTLAGEAPPPFEPDTEVPEEYLHEERE